MNEIVYFDANPTVRAILSRHFEQYDLRLVHLQALDQCASVLEKCRHPVIVLLDMSRNPEMLPQIQAVVPRYLRDPERCILMSDRPTALAPYLPPSLEECFFKHVIERPFKRLDFIQFFDAILQPYLNSSTSLVQSTLSSAINSSINQIVSQSIQVPADNFKREIEDIVITTSRSVPLAQLQEKAAAPAQDAANRRDNRMSRRSRYPSQSKPVAPPPVPGDSAIPHAPVHTTPTPVPAAMSRPAANARASSANPRIQSAGSRGSSANPRISTAGSRGTHPGARLPASGSHVSPPPAPPQTQDSLFRAGFQIPWLINIIRHSFLTDDIFTVIVRKEHDFLIIALQSGTASWLEYIANGHFTDASAFVAEVPAEYPIPKTDILNLLNPNTPLHEIFSTLHLEAFANGLAKTQARRNIPGILQFEGCPAHVFQGVPAEWRRLIDSRPKAVLNLMPWLFEAVRDNADTMLPPAAFRSFRFAARPNRTPLNHAIHLTPHESDLFEALASPKTLPELRLEGKKKVSDAIYRLYLFEFVDIVF